MSISAKDLDPAFQGAGQKEYPFLCYKVVLNISCQLQNMPVSFHLCVNHLNFPKKSALNDISTQEKKNSGDLNLKCMN